MRYSTWLLSGAALVIGLLLGLQPWRMQWSDPQPNGEANGVEAFVPLPGQIWFDDQTSAAGIQFRHNDAATPKHLIQETMGSGIGWIDYDHDGWPDLFCVQVSPDPLQANESISRTHQLYRNLGNGKFQNVTEQTGVGLSGYGMGVLVGDYNNDGFDDLLISELGRIRFLQNSRSPGGERVFVEVTEQAGLANPHWATSCAWGDIDNDGWLDLYVANYVQVNANKPAECKDFNSGLAQSCTPTAYPHVHHQLYRNRGDGRFEDISVSSGIAQTSPAPGLGVVMIDLDDDGLIDIYVANDMKPAYLFRNLGGGKFVETAIASGSALGRNGNTMAGMGVVAADVERSGRPSLFVTNFQHEPNVLFLNRGKFRFQEVSHQSGLGLTSLQRLGFGVVTLDANRDGWLDLAVVNGHVNRFAQRISSAPYAQEAQFYKGTAPGKFEDVSDKAGPYFRQRWVGRGLATADYDHDGRPDLAISNNGGPAVLLKNRTENDFFAIGFQLIGDGKKSNRNAIGARIEVESSIGTQVHFVTGGGSYLSANDRHQLVGLGQERKASRVTVRWPSGVRQEYSDLPANTTYQLVEGQADAVPLYLHR